MVTTMDITMLKTALKSDMSEKAILGSDDLGDIVALAILEKIDSKRYPTLQSFLDSIR